MSKIKVANQHIENLTNSFER
jgi:hypothetical protein